MKKSIFLKIAALALVLAMALCACGTPPSTAPASTAPVSGTGQTSAEAHPEISGTVTFAVRDNVLEQTQMLLREFRAIYPNIQVELQEFSSSDDLYTYLTTQSTAQNMPDVVLGWDNLSAFALQNWLYPLNEFLDADDEAQYISQELLEGFTYEGKVYAVPAYLLFSSVVVNLDLMDELNLEAPGYDWTIEEFMDLARAATTTTTSGINHLESLDQYLMMQLETAGAQWGYDPETRTFDLTSGAFVQAEQYVDDLRKVPQLVADDMRDADTTAAVKRFQELNGLSIDGVAGQQTQQKLFSSNAVPCSI